MATLGDYKLLKMLGQGAFSKVFLGEHMETGKMVALKVIDKNKKDGEIDFNELAEKEIEITKEISHPNIIKLHDSSTSEYISLGQCGRHKEVNYMALEIASEGELFDLIYQTGAFSERTARFYFLQLLDALEYLQGIGVSHCDIKLNNVLLDHNFNLKLSDFGLSTK